MVLEEAMRRAGAAEVVVSETDILDGIVYRLAADSGPSVAGPFM